MLYNSLFTLSGSRYYRAPELIFGATDYGFAVSSAHRAIHWSIIIFTDFFLPPNDIHAAIFCVNTSKLSFTDIFTHTWCMCISQHIPTFVGSTPILGFPGDSSMALGQFDRSGHWYLVRRMRLSGADSGAPHVPWREWRGPARGAPSCSGMSPEVCTGRLLQNACTHTHVVM